MRLRLLLSAIALGAASSSAWAQPAPKGKDDAEKDRVPAAVEKGRAYLQKKYDPRGRGPDRNEMDGLMQVAGFHGNGQAALSGMAMLESGIPAADLAVAAIANGLRQNALAATNTYEVSLVIMFLDRLGAKDDAGLIQFMTLRLLSGQCADGTWSYSCTGLNLDQVEQRQLAAQLVKVTRLVSVPGKKDAPKPPVKEKRDDLDFDPATPKPGPKDKPAAKTPPAPKEPADGLHPAVRKYAKLVNDGGKTDPRPPGLPGNLLDLLPRSASGDHSNTQFATVGMWCGRRHGVDTAAAFKLLEKHYRDCQGNDGGWGYTGSFGGSSAPMTCAGLMGLAMGFGAKNTKLATPGGAGNPEDRPPAPAADDPGNDKVLEKGLKCLGDYLAAAAAQGEPGGPGGRFRFRANELSKNLYFMWSLERVAMIYGLATVGKVDWYDWGSTCLLDAQQADGSWSGGNYHGSSAELDTAFALLFLNRANLAQDLSASLKGKVRDPGTSRLIGGGDLAKLLGPGAKSGSAATPPKRSDPDPAPMTPKTEPKTPQVPAPNEFDAKVRALVRAAVDADAGDQRKLLEDYRDAKGGEYTEALAQIATRLSDDPQAQARAALAARLTRMKAATLNEFLRDRDREIRRAAALACGAKGDKAHTPELIRLLADTDAGVIQAARGGLKQLSGQDFGPESAAGPADKSRAVLAWKKWWDGQK